MAFCSSCGKEIEEGVEPCPHCGQSTSDAPPSIPPSGKFSVEEVVVSSFELIKRKPLILVPELIATLFFIPFLFFDTESFESSDFGVNFIENLPNPGLFILAIIGFVILMIIGVSIIQGMYPLMVKNVMEGREVEMSDSFSKSLHKVPSLIPGFILVGLLVSLGLVLFIIPGVLLLLWFAYTTQAIMLDDLGALAGMSASKRFGRTVKWKTFLMALIIIIVAVVGSFVEIIPVVGMLLGTVVTLLVTVFGNVVFSYAYIKHGMTTPNPS